MKHLILQPHRTRLLVSSPRFHFPRVRALLTLLLLGGFPLVLTGLAHAGLAHAGRVPTQATYADGDPIKRNTGG